MEQGTQFALAGLFTDHLFFRAPDLTQEALAWVLTPVLEQKKKQALMEPVSEQRHEPSPAPGGKSLSSHITSATGAALKTGFSGTIAVPSAHAASN